MKRRRVKITGLGFVTPAGIGRTEFLNKIQEPVSRVSLLTKFPEDGGAFIGAEVRDFRVDRQIEGLNSKRMPRHTQFAVAAAGQAIRDAKIEPAMLRNPGVLVVIGAALMDFGAINKGIELILRHGPSAALPSSVSDTLVSSIGATVVEMIGGGARTMSFQSACCSGLDAIGSAAQKISTGEADLALCGGTESPLHYHPMLELRLAGLSAGNPDLPQRQSRPFDMWRTTGVIGEGACIVLLEAEDSPRAPYAFVEGHGFASDVPGKPCSGLFEAMRLAVGNAGVRPRDVEAVSAWGPGHKVLDAAEAQEMVKFFGGYVNELPAYSIKGAIGNPLGAAGAIQVGCAALGISRGLIPPTVNWQHPDPACPLNLSVKSRYISHRSIVVNAHGLSGTNSCLLLSQ